MYLIAQLGFMYNGVIAEQGMIAEPIALCGHSVINYKKIRLLT